MPDAPHPPVTPSRPEAAAEAAMPPVRGVRAAGGVSVGRGAGAEEACAMRSVPVSVLPPPPSGRRKR